jgi:nitroreductase/NAD-dependent dihydropyrimidine dehydrogenase PreA subunit
MELIQVDTNKCDKCGICAEVCPIGTIGMDENGPKAISALCIACGHCVAVCPSAALDNVRAPLANQITPGDMSVLAEDAAVLFLRKRRSVREFKKISVPREKIARLLDIARFAQTSGNSQGVSYNAIDVSETLRRITAVTVEWMETGPFGEPFAAVAKHHIANYHTNGSDIILRGAPCLVIPIVDKSSLPIGRDSTLFSLSYAELFAPVIGLGTCITGFFNACADSGYKPMLDILNLPDNVRVTGGLMVGYPKYAYRRLADRNPLRLTWM